jgi:hypothetical protein
MIMIFVLYPERIETLKSSQIPRENRVSLKLGTCQWHSTVVAHFVGDPHAQLARAHSHAHAHAYVNAYAHTSACARARAQ